MTRRECQLIYGVHYNNSELFRLERDVGVNGNHLFRSSNSVISSGLVIQFTDAVVVS